MGLKSTVSLVTSSLCEHQTKKTVTESSGTGSKSSAIGDLMNNCTFMGNCTHRRPSLDVEY